MTRILPLRTGWAPPGGDAAGYPPDLPEDWQLSYFSNAYWGVLVPAPLWTAADAGTLAAWVADTPERFRFYFEAVGLSAAPSHEATCALLDRAIRVLGQRLGGLVGDPDGLAPVAQSACPRLLCIDDNRVSSDPNRNRHKLRGPRRESLFEPRASHSDGVALIVPGGLLPDLRSARRWLAERMDVVSLDGSRRSIPILLGPCTLTELELWQSLVELMGLA